MSRKKFSSTDIFGTRLKAWRKAAGLTGIQLSEIIGISQGALSGIETGKSSPAASTIEAIIRNTDINPTWLLTGEGPMLREQGAGSEKESNFLDKSHAEVISMFKNHDLARELNQLLVQIERIDPEALIELRGYLKATRDNLEKTRPQPKDDTPEPIRQMAAALDGKLEATNGKK